MDNLYEKEIVKSFFKRRYRERLIYELSSKNKRVIALGRLCHCYEDVLENKYMEKVSPEDLDNICETLRSYGATDSCYSISDNYMIDGKYMNLEEAIDMAICFGRASLVVCIPDELAYFQEEQEQGFAPRYILRKKNNQR